MGLLCEMEIKKYVYVCTFRGGAGNYCIRLKFVSLVIEVSDAKVTVQYPQFEKNE